MSNIAIKVENLSKIYRLGEIGTGTISRDMERWFKTKVLKQEDPFLMVGETNDRTNKGVSDIVYSLRDINFEIKQGDAVGIIGRNGAGKSTLLKILSRVTTPTKGKINIKGRVASLLEVGTGFHPELTGRENIFINGAILGMRKREIDQKIDEIIDFSGVERYIDTPVKRYSSGMYVRLAFAVAAHLESEILIVDEILAVGDAEFQKKCLGKMEEVSKNDGRTVLFVSHNLSAISSLCDNGIYLKHGQISFDGQLSEAFNLYNKSFSDGIKHKWEGIDGDHRLSLRSISINAHEENRILLNSQELIIRLIVSINIEVPDLVVGLYINNYLGSPIIGLLYNDYNNERIGRGDYELEFRVPKYIFAEGSYQLVTNISIPNVERVTTEKSNLSFNIIAESKLGNRYFLKNNANLNSVIRPNWFNSIRLVSDKTGRNTNS